MSYYSDVRSNIECSNDNLDIQIKNNRKINPKFINRLIIINNYYYSIFARFIIFYEHVRVSMAENSSGHEKSNVRQLIVD